MTTFDPQEEPAGDAETVTPAPEPSLEQRIANGVSAQSRRDSGKWNTYGDQQAHTPRIEFQQSRVVLSFICLGGGGYRARFVQVNLTPAAIDHLAEWKARHEAEVRQQKAAAKRRAIQRALAALAGNQPLFEQVRSLLEGYEQMLEDTAQDAD